MSETVTVSKATKQKPRLPIREDFLTSPLTDLSQVRLRGTHCRSCGETFLGDSVACENCQSTDLAKVVLGDKGTLFTYTVVRGRPPGDYVGPDPFVPYAVGLIELPEGLRLLTVLKDVDVDNVPIGATMELVIEKLCDDAEGNEIITYKFRPSLG